MSGAYPGTHGPCDLAGRGWAGGGRRTRRARWDATASRDVSTLTAQHEATIVDIVSLAKGGETIMIVEGDLAMCKFMVSLAASLGCGSVAK